MVIKSFATFNFILLNVLKPLNFLISDTKKTISIEMRYRDIKQDKSVDLSLFHGSTNFENLIIEGDDRNWVHGTFNKIDEQTKACKPQVNFIIKKPLIVTHIIALGLGIIITNILFAIIDVFRGPVPYIPEWAKAPNAIVQELDYLRILILIFLYWFMGLMPALSVTEWILKLWPSIEFDFGPSHLKYEKSRRLKFTIIITLIIIPIIVSIIVEILKNVI